MVRKSQHAFSAIALDQAHEQNNAMIKGDGGAIGLTTNPAALNRWIILGPKIARLIDEFQTSNEKNTDLLRHELKRSKQLTFARDVS